MGVGCFFCSAQANEPFFKKNDVIALVGGEDMVAMSEYGYLELLLQRALPDYHLKFRDLAWEGDTVFEQRRDLNFPPLEAQLDQVGATVVICQFGQMESLGKSGRRSAEESEVSKEEIAEFVAAYEKLIVRMSGGGKRNIAMIFPAALGDSQSWDRWGNAASARRMNELQDKLADFEAYRKASEAVATKHYVLFVDLFFMTIDDGAIQYDGVHLGEKGQRAAATWVAPALTHCGSLVSEVMFSTKPAVEPLLNVIRAKNRLWFNYWRVENWAFLAGDRTEQPSSRDHLDRNRRWFPAEREKFLPLIETKEQEIWALAAKLATP